MRDLAWPVTSYLAEALRAAGFVLLGRTNVPEMGTTVTTEARSFPPARNPWDPGRSAGGSSGRSAAAVASGMVAGAHGNRGGGALPTPPDPAVLVGLEPPLPAPTLAPTPPKPRPPPPAPRQPAR